MSLLTQEQIAKSEMIRETQFLRSELSKAAANDCQTLLDIIDDLQSRAPKQCTEQELREAFESANNTYRLEKEKFGRRTVYENQHVQTEFEGWSACARFLGALKAEP